MTVSEAEVGVLEVDAGDAPTFSVVVDPFAVDTTMTATITDPSAVSTSFTMTPSVDHSTWTGTAAALSVPGEYTAKFTIVGTGESPNDLDWIRRRIGIVEFRVEPVENRFQFPH